MAKSQADRSKESKEKAKAKGQEELRHYVWPGTKAKLAELMSWHGLEVTSEAFQNMIINLHALGPEGSAPAMATPRHEITISENVARELYQQGARRAAALDANDQA